MSHSGNFCLEKLRNFTSPPPVEGLKGRCIKGLNASNFATGSRRYICLTIPDGQQIDNSGNIEYDQLYAQVLYELREF